MFAERFLKATGDFVTQTFVRHGKEIPICLADGGLEVFADVTADVKNVAPVIDKDRWLGIPLQDELIGQGLETVSGILAAGLASVRCGGARAKGGREFEGLRRTLNSLCRKSLDLPLRGTNRSVKPPIASALPKNKIPPGFRL